VFTRVLESYSLGDWRSDEPSFEARMRSWYEAPDRWRAEGDYLWRTIDGTTVAHSSISVWDGSEVWQYDSAEERVTVHRQDYEGGISLRGHTMVLGAVLPDIPSLLAGSCRTPQIVDDGEVAGRPAYVLALSRPRCGRSSPGHDGKRLLWIDRETGLVLRWESYTVVDLLSSVSWMVEIEIDGAIDDGRFDFVPPPGAAIDDRRDESSALFQWSVEPPAPIALDDARVAATFPLVVPVEVPPGFELESVQNYWSSELARELRSHADWVLLRYVDEQGNWLQIPPRVRRVCQPGPTRTCRGCVGHRRSWGSRGALGRREPNGGWMGTGRDADALVGGGAGRFSSSGPARRRGSVR
jgi:outer membrane lipoprotein-sorting protein